MKTIYDRLIQCQQRMTLNCFKVNITDHLVNLLKTSCAIDLSHEPYPFVRDGGSLLIDVVIHYKFKYGNVSILAKDDKLQVTFFFDYVYREMLNIPLHANCCTVNVDHNLNFISSVFTVYFCFSMNTFDSEDNKNQHLNITLTHTVEADKTYNSLSYNIHDDKYLDIVDGFDKRFYMHNVDFELLLIKFINFVAYSPHVFYSGFSQYPKYIDIITDLKAIVKFINIFTEQYFNDHDNLIYTIEQHLLLVDMHDI